MEKVIHKPIIKDESDLYKEILFLITKIKGSNKLSNDDKYDVASNAYIKFKEKINDNTIDFEKGYENYKGYLFLTVKTTVLQELIKRNKEKYFDVDKVDIEIGEDEDTSEVYKGILMGYINQLTDDKREYITNIISGKIRVNRKLKNEYSMYLSIIRELKSLNRNKDNEKDKVKKNGTKKKSVESKFKNKKVKPVVSPEQIEFIKEHYPIKGATYCSKELNLSHKTIFKYAKLNNLRRNDTLSPEQIEFIREHYPTKGSLYCSKELGFKYITVYQCVRRLNLVSIMEKKPNNEPVKKDKLNNRYTIEEIEFIREHYPTKGMKYIIKHMPHKTEKGIRFKIYNLGLKFDFENNDISKFLKEHYPTKGVNYCSNKLGLSKGAVKLRAIRLNLKIDKLKITYHPSRKYLFKIINVFTEIKHESTSIEEIEKIIDVQNLKELLKLKISIYGDWKFELESL